MQQSLVFTFICDDKTGVVEQLSKIVAEAGGNWLESRMTKLAGKFTGIVQLSIAEENRQALETKLNHLSSDDFSMLIDEVTSDNAESNKQSFELSVIGLDRPGIVREVAQALAKRSINVVEMHSLIESAPMSAEPLFKAEVQIQAPLGSDIENLEDELDEIGSELDLEWSLQQIN